MTKPPHRILLVIADDHPVFLRGLANLFRSHPEIKLAAQCHTGTAAINAIRRLAPDIAMIDISIPGLNGLDVLKAVVTEGHQTRVIFLTADLSDTQIKDAILGGVKGIILKSSPPEAIVRGIRKVAGGNYQFPKDLAAELRKRRMRRQNIVHYSRERLTKREAEVAQLVAKGLSNREISQQMDLSEGTVKIHLHNIFTKLDIPNRTSLATYIVSRHTAG